MLLLVMSKTLNFHFLIEMVRLITVRREQNSIISTRLFPSESELLIVLQKI